MYVLCAQLVANKIFLLYPRCLSLFDVQSRLVNISYSSIPGIKIEETLVRKTLDSAKGWIYCGISAAKRRSDPDIIPRWHFRKATTGGCEKW